ncbi:MAG: OsmC family protein [Vicinamibacterales bacterium]
MQPFPHQYRAQLSAGSDGYGRLTGANLPLLDTASPVEFGGPGDAWSPEQLLLGAVEACFLFTLRAVARASKLDVMGVDVEATGTVERQERIVRFTAIALHPVIRVPVGTDRERVLKVVEKTEANCLVTASLLTPVRVTPEIRYEAVAQPA